MHFTSPDATTIGKFEKLSEFEHLLHFVSTRVGGISTGSFESLNIGFHVGDDNFRVLKNRKILADEVGVGLDKFTFANQCHSSNVAIVDSSGRGKGAMEQETALANTDGMVTNVPYICLSVQVADCVPILLYDPTKEVIASLHAGWKGTLRKIVTETVGKMVQHYGTKAENILAALGPSNGPCCYEVGNDVVREARMTLGNTYAIIRPSKTPGKFIFDQWAANRRQLIDAGVKEAHIENSGICCQCNHDQFYSNRAGQGHTGRYMAGIMIKKH